MFEWMLGFAVVLLVLLVVYMFADDGKHDRIAVFALFFAIIMTVVMILSAIVPIVDQIDVKTELNEGSTYLVKSPTYSGDKVTLGLRKIDVATNETIGPEFLHKRNAEIPDLKAGDIIIYQDGKASYWVSPF